VLLRLQLQQLLVALVKGSLQGSRCLQEDATLAVIVVGSEAVWVVAAEK
jgi:hypothetical protein